MGLINECAGPIRPGYFLEHRHPIGAPYPGMARFVYTVCRRFSRCRKPADRGGGLIGVELGLRMPITDETISRVRQGLGAQYDVLLLFIQPL